MCVQDLRLVQSSVGASDCCLRLPSSLAVLQYERLGLATRRCVIERIFGSNSDSTGLLQIARGYKEAAWLTCMLSFNELLQHFRSTVVGLACICKFTSVSLSFTGCENHRAQARRIYTYTCFHAVGLAVLSSSPDTICDNLMQVPACSPYLWTSDGCLLAPSRHPSGRWGPVRPATCSSFRS